MRNIYTLFLFAAALLGAVFLSPAGVAFAANSAPVLDATKSPVLSAEAEDSGAPVGAVGTQVSSLIDSTTPAGGLDNYTDADSDSPGIAITAVDTSNMTCYYSVNAGSSWSTIGAVSSSSARLLAANSNNRIYCQPSPDFNGTVATAITFRAWDQTSGTDGGLASTAVNGGTAAFSTATDTASLTFTPVNDAPVLDASKSPALSSVTAGTSAPSGAVGTLISSLVDFASPSGQVDNVTDIDSGASLGIAVISKDSNLTCYYSLNGGTSWSSIGAISSTSARLLAADSDNRIYCNTSLSGTYNSALTFRAWDQTSGADGDLANASVNGGTTAFSTASDSVSLVVNPAHAFITTWKTDNPGTSNSNQITIPAVSSGNNYDVDWGDSTTSTGLTGSATHTYSAAGTYTVKITGTFTGMFFVDGGDREKLLSVEQWGVDTEWVSMSGAFFGCDNMVVNATDAPDLSATNDMTYAFRGTTFSNSLDNWDVSSISYFLGTFQDAAFNGDISDWDTSGATTLAAMFYNDAAFNQDIGGWDTGNVTSMNAMFYHDTAFNQSLATWNTASVSDMSDMFNGATAFDQDLGPWNVSSLTGASGMFAGDTLSTANYDSLLHGWSLLGFSLHTGVHFDAGNSTFCDIQSWAFLHEVPVMWSYTDGGIGPCDFELSQVTPIPEHISNPADAVYHFSANQEVEDAYAFHLGDYLSEQAGCADCEVLIDPTNHTVSFDGLQGGDDVDFHFAFQTDGGGSNDLEVGPFSLPADVHHSGGGGGGGFVATTAAAPAPGCLPSYAFDPSTGKPCSSAAAPAFAPGRTLKYKMTGSDVLALQKYLNAHGFALAASGAGSPGQETAYFGLLTVKAAKAFQASKGLVPDGIVGPLTQAAMQS